MNKILVTGSDGFVGHWLCRYLESCNYEVVRVDSGTWACHPHEETNHLDITNEVDCEVLSDYIVWADCVVHLAAQINVDHSIEDMEQTMNVNVNATTNIIRDCLEYNTRFVFASSSEIYGSSERPISELHPLNGQSPYAASKIAADRLCYAAMATWPEFDCTIVRSFNTFGPGQRQDSYGGVIAKFIDAAMKDEPLIVYGDGRQRRDYVYVLDVVRGYMMAVEGKLPPVVNLATGRTHRIVDIARDVIRMVGSNSQIEFGENRRGEVQCLIGDASLARAYGWESTINFQDGLRRCVKYVKGERDD